MTSEAAMPPRESSRRSSRESSPSVDFGIIFKRKVAIVCVLLVAIHQSIVAGSTLFLTSTISKFQSGQDYFADLCFYLAAMAIPYLPGCASFVAMQRWINQAHQALVENFTSAVTSACPSYRNHTVRESVTAVLARNSFPVLKDYISFVHDLASFSLNSLLSISVIVFLLPGQLAGGYCLSLAVCFLIVIALQKTIAKTSSDCEYAYLQYSGALCDFWPNVALGNAHNESIWHDQRVSTGQRFYDTSNRLEALRQWGNVLLAAASLGPTMFLIISIVRDSTVEAAVIAALIVSLTRIFLIVNSLSTLVYRALDYASLHARIKVLFDAKANLFDHEGTDTNVIDVRVNGSIIRATSEGKRLIAACTRGRFTITGANGSGKSTFLLALKREYGAACFLLPADCSGLAWKKDCHSLSTGQRLSEHLIEILQLENVQYILLDEWDANLDRDNIQSIEKILDTLSATRVIVEVRHRKPLNETQGNVDNAKCT
jgi:hypothetical protein